MSADKKQIAAWIKQQERIPVGSRVSWTTGTYHVDQAGHTKQTGIVVSHTERNGMTQVKPDSDPFDHGDFRAPSCVFEPSKRIKQTGLTSASAREEVA